MDQQPLLCMQNIVKTFPGVLANDDISIEVRKGEIHCLLGENGAGKTVLMSILTGLYLPDSGEILFNGKPLKMHSPKDAIQYRIGMVHQHFMLVPTLSVVENIILGQYLWNVLPDMKKVANEIQKLGRTFSLDIDPFSLISDLSVGEQQRVEILKNLYRGADLLILDEPTAVLTPQETDGLLSFLRDLANSGMTIIFITHKLEEVMQVSDRITVLRDGKVVATVNTSDTCPRELSRLMVGRDVLLEIPPKNRKPGNAMLSAKNLVVKSEIGEPAVNGVTFDVREGEIVGIAGVSGNGQTELALALARLLPLEGGEIYLCGEPVHNLSIRELSKKGLAHIPEDRHKMGVILPFSVADNFILHDFFDSPISKHGFLDFKLIREHAQGLVNKFKIRVSDVNQVFENLSGGNQQKVVVARELDRHPRFLLANQPTRGIDIGATEFVLQQLQEYRDAGTAILLVSTELDELITLSDRILVMFEGKIMGEAAPSQDSIDEIGMMMAGKTKDSI